MNNNSNVKPLVLAPNEGRHYGMGRMSAVFKADLEQTNSALSVSEWWLEPNTEGPPLHKHEEAHMWYVLEGCLAIYLEGKGWFEVEQGAYVFIPGDIEHGFENRSMAKAGFISFNTPGGFESSMPHIKHYFDANPLGDANKNKP